MWIITFFLHFTLGLGTAFSQQELQLVNDGGKSINNKLNQKIKMANFILNNSSLRKRLNTSNDSVAKELVERARDNLNKIETYMDNKLFLEAGAIIDFVLRDLSASSQLLNVPNQKKKKYTKNLEILDSFVLPEWENLSDSDYDFLQENLAKIDELRNDFRRRANERFTSRRRTAQTDAYTQNYEQARQLMAKRQIFDIAKEPAKLQERYGKHALGQQCLLARRLLENGITFCQVSHSNYDTHNENFNFHHEQLGEFDRSYSALIEDLATRGMLESTMVVVMSEFGRTPRINKYYGRDHWGTAWSVCLGGGKIKPGAVIGKTNKNGTAVADRQVDHGHLFHAYLQGVGLDSSDNFNIGGRPMPMADPSKEGIKELIV